MAGQQDGRTTERQQIKENSTEWGQLVRMIKMYGSTAVLTATKAVLSRHAERLRKHGRHAEARILAATAANIQDAS